MIIDAETKHKLYEMGARDLAAAIEAQDDVACMQLTFSERLGEAVDAAYSEFVNTKVSSAIKSAKLRFPKADIRNLLFVDDRHLDMPVVRELGTCAYINRSTNVILQGFTGSGKSYLACALMKEACRKLISSRYIRVPDLREEWEAAKSKPQGEAKMLRKYSKFDLLCLDEWVLDKPDAHFRSFLFELIERRYDNKSTMFGTQYPKKDWHQRLGGGVHADSIMDRIVHNAVWLDAGDVNMREKLGTGEGK